MAEHKQVSGVFVGSTQISGRYLGDTAIGGIYVPPKYERELAYLQSTGVQWINTGVACLMNTTAEYSVEVDTGVATSANTYELTGYSSGWYFGLVTGSTGPGRNWTIFTGVSGTMTTPTVVADTAYAVIQTWESNKLTTTVSDGTDTGTNSRIVSASASNQFRLFGLYQASGNSYPCKSLRIRGAKYTQGGVLLRDFMPVIDVKGVPCMYDKVSGELFYNKGMGTFAYGELDGEAVSATYTSEEISVMAASLPVTMSLDDENSAPKTDEEIVQAYVEFQRALSEAEANG